MSGAARRSTAAPARRPVRPAAVHFRPRGCRSLEDSRRRFAPLIAGAARQKADPVVLGECLTFAGTSLKYHETAEPIPGPSTQYFGELARNHDLYIVAGLVKGAGHLVYSTAVLLAPDGSLAGKYRKVTLPTGEVEGGVAPGTDCPVFATRFGKLGIMICHDVFFPEVARQLAMRGGAIDNHVYLVTSTYMDPADEWMRSGVFDHYGRLIASAGTGGTVAVAEVDLAKKTDWRWLGHFAERIPHDRPVRATEDPVK